MKLDKDLYERASNILMTYYDVQYTKDPDDDFVWVFDVDVINSIIEDLLDTIDSLEEKITDIVQDVNENYTRTPIEQQIKDIE